MRAKYKSIVFGKDIKKMSFAEFKKVYEVHHDFRGLLPKKRETELKKAFKIYQNVNTSGTTKKSDKTNTPENKE